MEGERHKAGITAATAYVWGHWGPSHLSTARMGMCLEEWWAQEKGTRQRDREGGDGNIFSFFSKSLGVALRAFSEPQGTRCSTFLNLFLKPFAPSKNILHDSVQTMHTGQSLVWGLCTILWTSGVHKRTLHVLTILSASWLSISVWRQRF